MTAFGTSPLGSDLGPFGGPGLMTVLAVLPLGANRCVVVFDVAPLADDTQGPHSAVNPNNYAITAVDPTYTSPTVPAPGIVPAGAAVPTRSPRIAEAVVDEADPTQVVLVFDCPLERGISYDVQISPGICGAHDEDFAGPEVWRFAAPAPPIAASPGLVSEERFRDFDYLVAPTPTQEGGTYRSDANGDVGIQDANTSLKKRIYRRIFSGRGAFAFLGDYGVGADRVKQLAKPGFIQGFASTAAEQIRAEPDVSAAAVEARMDVSTAGAFLIVDAYVRRTDARTVRLNFREPVP